MAVAAVTVAEAAVAAPAAPRQSTAAVGVHDVRPLVRDLLEWIERAPRTYADVTETWRSTCPRFTVWEDALEARLVRLERCAGMRCGEERVALTELGNAALAAVVRDSGNER